MENIEEAQHRVFADIMDTLKRLYVKAKGKGNIETTPDTEVVLYAAHIVSIPGLNITEMKWRKYQSTIVYILALHAAGIDSESISRRTKVNQESWYPFDIHGVNSIIGKFVNIIALVKKGKEGW